jgi:hypothetical protein
LTITETFNSRFIIINCFAAVVTVGAESDFVTG